MGILLLADIASWQGELSFDTLEKYGVNGINVKISHGVGFKSVHPLVSQYIAEARARGWEISCFHWLDNSATGYEQAQIAYGSMFQLDLHSPGRAVHVVDCEDTVNRPGKKIYQEYVQTMERLLERPIYTYTGDWWIRRWGKTWTIDRLWAAPNVGYLPKYPGDDAEDFWKAGYAGRDTLDVMQYMVEALHQGEGDDLVKIRTSLSVVRQEGMRAWNEAKGTDIMAMNPRTHRRGAAPNFSHEGLPPNPIPSRITNALWWLVCMRDRLEPLSQNGGVFANKDGYHNAGENLEDHGQGNAETDHSIRRAPDRAGPWWEEFAAAHDWTFDRAHTGNYTEINLYMRRRIDAMRSLTDLRPDNVYAYTIGNLDGDVEVEGWNEYRDDWETGDSTHLWHIHDSFRRNIVGDYWAMWKALTIDMGWSYEEWQNSVREAQNDMTPEEMTAWATSADGKAALGAALADAIFPAPAGSNDPDGKWLFRSYVTNTYGATVNARTYAAEGRTAAQAALVKVTEDDGEKQEILTAIGEQQTPVIDLPSLAALILQGLPAGTLTEEQVQAAAERAVTNVLREGVGEAPTP